MCRLLILSEAWDFRANHFELHCPGFSLRPSASFPQDTFSEAASRVRHQKQQGGIENLGTSGSLPPARGSNPFHVTLSDNSGKDPEPWEGASLLSPWPSGRPGVALRSLLFEATLSDLMACRGWWRRKQMWPPQAIWWPRRTGYRNQTCSY